MNSTIILDAGSNIDNQMGKNFIGNEMSYMVGVFQGYNISHDCD